MAHKESDKITADKYTLGGYTFDFTERDTSVFVTCTGPDGKKATKGASIGQAKIDGWYVEANEDTASVYIIEKIPIGDKHSSYEDLSFPVASSWTYKMPDSSGEEREYYISTPYGLTGAWYMSHASHTVSQACGSATRTDQQNLAFTYKGKTVYYTAGTFVGAPVDYIFGIPDWNGDAGLAAWVMVYGNSEYDEYELKEVLIARFAINAAEAGGGPEDSYDDPDDWEDWDDPEDYDPEEDPIEWGDPDYPDPEDPDYPEPIDPDDPDYPDPEDPDYPGDQDGDGEPDPYHPDYYPPTKTLYLTVTGATSGTHESGTTAAPNETAADYGCGGNGGHGGGGGAGASTVIIHKFATSKANSKEVTAISKPHGYGSGGGKGGKGGDGIILIYY